MEPYLKTPRNVLEPIIRDMVYKDREPDEQTEKNLNLYFTLVEHATKDTCFICGCGFECADVPRHALSVNLEMYVCPDCFTNNKEFIDFVLTIIW